jgi:hypothetical protein
MSRTMVFGGRCRCTLSIHWPGRSTRAVRFSGPAQPFRLKTPHLASRRGRADDRPVADHPAHCRIAAQPLGVVHVLIAGQPPEHRLAQQAGQPMATVLAGARIGECIGSPVGKAQGVIQLAVGQYPASEVIAEPRNRSSRRRSKSSLSAALSASPDGSPITAPLVPPQEAEF